MKMSYKIKSHQEYIDAYRQSKENPEIFWDEVASNFQWRKKWKKTLEWNFNEPNVNWFLGGKLNITENCLDRHLKKNGDKVALIWEANDIKEASRKFTYRQLYHEVCKMANVLKNMGVKKGDRVCIYLPMIPELTFAVLACARIGAIHSVVFAGFSASAISDRLIDAEATFIITSDGMNRGPKAIAIKETVDIASENIDNINKILVINRLNISPSMKSGRDFWYHELVKGVSNECESEEMDSEDMLFILYTSGSTGKPKGVVHTCGGYMVYSAYTFANVFQYEADEIFWCTADIGWVTGHSYIIYGPLANGATTLMFEGIPTYPDVDRFWAVVDKHKVNTFYTAPTAIRSLMAFGTEPISKYDLSSLKKLGSVGEPINEEAYHWFQEHVGKGNCPLVDTWWQTETGGILITTLAGVNESKPSYAGYPLPGVFPCLVTPEGLPIEGNDVEGYLCIDFPWPSILRTTYGDHERCRINYFAAYQNKYFTGDGAYRDPNGLYRIIGRVDDVINVSGHRFGTAEIENAIDENEAVIECAVVGYPHDIKGQGIYAFVILESQYEASEEIRKSIIETVLELIGPIAKPDKIQFVSGLPKTRSGKIMRRILRKIAEGDTSNIGDITTLIDPLVVEKIKQGIL
jgi:acetyl-CoA synthetase